MLLYKTLFLFLGVISSTSAFYSKKDAVIEVTDKTFKKEVMDTSQLVLAEFYAPWCGHCKNLAPEYKKAGEKLKGLAKVVAIDCDTHKSLCGLHQIQGFPTIKLFTADKKKSPQDYQGGRTAKDIVDYVVDKLPLTYVTKLEASGYDAFLEKQPELPKVFLVHSKGAVPPLYKALSLEYNNRATFAFGKEKDTALLEKLSIKSVPAVVVVTPSKEIVAFDGKLKHDPLVEFLNKYAAPVLVKEKAEKKKKAKAETKKPAAKEEKKEEATRTTEAEEKPSPTKAPFDPVIPELTSEEDFNKQCREFDGVCAITFVNYDVSSPESKKEYEEAIETIRKLKKQLHEMTKPIAPIFDIYKFVWVNSAVRGKKIIRDFDIADASPAMVTVTMKKEMFRIYRGAWETAGIEKYLELMAMGIGRSVTFWEGLEVRLDAAPKIAEEKGTVVEERATDDL
ncbi:protein disulfide isomerase (PDI) protein [Nowakowskiella sp. JEL0407]|nr:protein disulfide isomerase (PDI) protein [Nowakowskiella sp. JEL0407]